jgi:cob(I)alamin adenosyltransferase
MSIATQTGDDGTTGLMYGRRVPKNHPRVETYGTIDELNAALGVARSLAGATEFIGESLLAIQKNLVTVMGELAVVDEDRERYATGGFAFVTTSMVDDLTDLVNRLEKDHEISFKGWATPGGTPLAAALDVARTVCRRAERRLSDLIAIEGAKNPEIGRFLNRLSDVCWLMARLDETRRDVGEAAS